MRRRQIQPSARCSSGLAAGCASREKRGPRSRRPDRRALACREEGEEREYYSVLKQAFRDLDYVEGKNAEFLHRYPVERIERFEQLAKDLVDCNTELIVVVKIRGAAASRLIRPSRS